MELAPSLAPIQQDYLILLHAIFILASHIGVLALEDLELKLDRLRFEIILMGFIFLMEKKIAGRFCIKKPEQQTGQRAGRIALSHQPFWALNF